MRSIYLSILFIVTPLLLFSQDRFLTVTSKDSIFNQPKFKTSVGSNIKLNGYYDAFGGLQDSDTFNIGAINVFGTDDSSSFHMDLYQTQIKLEGSFVEKNGNKIYSLIEFDFWGGDGKMRLRKAFVEFHNWQIGQNWNNFGDEVLWPDIMEWEGPPSGIWTRSPHIKYFNTFKNEKWIYEASLEAPISNYISFKEIDIGAEEAHQAIPDITAAIKYKFDKGHLRISSILRNIRFKQDEELDNFIGYGFSFSGIYTSERRNNVQFQLVGGKGITAYMTTISGLGYDGYPDINNDFVSTPSIGGWMSYEYFFTERLYSTVVFGYTNYDFIDMQEFTLNSEEENKDLVIQGDFLNTHYYGIINLMFEPFERMTFGLELNYGTKDVELNGFVDDDFIKNNKSRDAMRISFGLMFYL